MDGKTLLNAVEKLLQESSDSGILDDFTTFQFLNQAAEDIAFRTGALTGSSEITTVANTSAYDLPADFNGLYLRDGSQNLVLPYTDGSTTSSLGWEDSNASTLYNAITSTAGVPVKFSVIDKGSLLSRVSGSALAEGASSGGESTLSGADFDNVSAGDIVHNTTDGSTGVVLAKSGTTSLTTALFDGTSNDWSTDDGYVIQPQPRNQINLTPKPSGAGKTLTVHYIARPAPVYSDYGAFRFPYQFTPALTKYAAWLYKYKDKDPNYGDKWYVHYDQQLRQMAARSSKMYETPTFTMSLKG